MSKPNLTLQPSKAIITQAAAEVYAAYIAAGRIKDEETDDWIKRSIREVFLIARIIDSSFYSDREMPADEQPVIAPPAE
jgi:hypothetical protein